MQLLSAPFNSIRSAGAVALALAGCSSGPAAPEPACSEDPQEAPYRIRVLPESVHLRVGDGLVLHAYASDANGEVENPTLEWTSTQPAVADVQALGDSALVKAVGEGEAEVIVSLGQSCGSATVTGVATLPPDTSLIAFVHWDGWSDVSSIRVIRADGSEEWTLESFGVVGNIGNLSGFPHGHRVALSVGHDFPLEENVADLVLLDVHDPASPRLDFYKWDFSPSVDPAGETLVFRVKSDQGMPDSIAIATVDGSEHSVIAEGGGSPTWTPAGDSIIFYRDHSIFRIHRAGGPETLLADLGMPASDFEYSPDGARLLLTGYGNDPNGEIYLVNADGSGLERLSYREGVDRAPSWSADGARFVFTRGDRLAIQELGDTSSVLLTLYRPGPAIVTAVDPAWLR